MSCTWHLRRLWKTCLMSSCQMTSTWHLRRLCRVKCLLLDTEETLTNVSCTDYELAALFIGAIPYICEFEGFWVHNFRRVPRWGLRTYVGARIFLLPRWGSEEFRRSYVWIILTVVSSVTQEMEMLFDGYRGRDKIFRSNTHELGSSLCTRLCLE